MHPAWWTSGLAASAEAAANAHWPNEVCGLWVETESSGGVALQVLPGRATPTMCAASLDALVEFAYEALDAGHRVVASFHSHPGGSTRFSQRDEALHEWARHHLIYAFDGVRWQAIWYVTAQSNGMI